MRTQVCIIGGGPSGLLLSHLLHRKGIDTVVLERRSRDYVLGRIRAGVLEFGMVELLREAGVGARMDAEGFVHDGIHVARQDRDFRIDFKKLTGKQVMIYGQTELTHDLYDARDAMGGVVIDQAVGVSPKDLDSDALIATTSSVAMAFTGSAAPAFPTTCCASSNGSIPLAGLACCRKPRRSATN